MGYDMYREGADNDADGDGYFRLNIWGMGEARGELMPIGIVRRADSPAVPMREDYPEDDAYEEAIRQWREGSHSEAPGIPSYKLGSNDGWLVNQVEIKSGVGWADEHHPHWRARLDDYVAEFVSWMEGSEKGFRVW